MLRLAGLFYHGVLVALQRLDALGSEAFEGGDGVLSVPRGHELLLLTTHAIAGVGGFHVLVGAGNGASGLRGGFRFLIFNLHLTTAKVATRLRQRPEIVVTAYRVHSTDGRYKVVHIRLHIPVFQVDLFRTTSPLEGLAFAVHARGMALAPFGEGAAKVFSRHNVLPLHFLGPFLMLLGGKPHWRGDVLLLIKHRPTIEGNPMIMVHLVLEYFLGFVE